MSRWKREGGKTELEVVVPPNCSATIHFPNEPGRSVTERSGYAEKIGEQGSYLLFEAGSGRYLFEN
ncbi:alpha-L-rhamnosidase C-terminal domain-containing protein [Porphyromonas levii]|uniref:alpha-L-rhamnosidase C-terminal domain-containing protein n=1 Tax=Porphyromonas levii TaxID=28114 RepID=UPI003D160E88